MGKVRNWGKRKNYLGEVCYTLAVIILKQKEKTCTLPG